MRESQIAPKVFTAKVNETAIPQMFYEIYKSDSMHYSRCIHSIK